MSKFTKQGRFSICCLIGGHKWELDNTKTSNGTAYFKCWHCGARQIFLRPDEYVSSEKIDRNNIDLLWLLEDE